LPETAVRLIYRSVRRNIRNRAYRAGLSRRLATTQGHKSKQPKSGGTSNYAVAILAKSGDLRP